jgi:GNAT superfamily N-acetyltransferase
MNAELNSEILIRPFRPEDQSETRDLILAGLGEHFGSIDYSLNPDLDDIKTAYLDKGHFFLVTTVGSRVVAACGLVLETDTTARIVRLSVDLHHRGRGIGFRLVNQVIDLAREIGLRQILVETNLDWYQAISLYRRCGFDIQRSDSTSNHFVLDMESVAQ